MSGKGWDCETGSIIQRGSNNCFSGPLKTYSDPDDFNILGNVIHTVDSRWPKTLLMELVPEPMQAHKHDESWYLQCHLSSCLSVCRHCCHIQPFRCLTCRTCRGFARLTPQWWKTFGCIKQKSLRRNKPSRSSSQKNKQEMRCGQLVYGVRIL